jgi:hypothetical protein
MGTHCFIVLENPDKTVRYIFCHYDGYFANMIPILQKYYSTRSSIEKLIENGSIVSLQDSEQASDKHSMPVEELRNRWDFRHIWLENRTVNYYYIFTKEDEWYCESKYEMRFDDVIPKK